MKAIRVLLADDHPVVRRGMRAIIDAIPGILVVGEVQNGEAVLAMVAQTTPDVVLLDIEMPGMSGVEVAQQLRAHNRRVRILALSGHDNAIYVRRLLRVGVAGYLTKEEAPEIIVEAIQRIARGERGWLSQRVAAQVSTWMQAQGEKKAVSDRELDVLQLVAQGKTNYEIGRRLRISEKTVEKHVRALFHKLNATSRVELAVGAINDGWV